MGAGVVTLQIEMGEVVQMRGVLAISSTEWLWPEHAVQVPSASLQISDVAVPLANLELKG